MSDLGLQIARVSVEWARIGPRRGYFDTQALERYRTEYQDLVDRGIQPLVTLHHFSHPLWFEDLGAFTKEENVPLFLRFARKVLEFLGDVVDDWVTINEPNVYATQAYLFNETPPGGKPQWGKLRNTLRNMALAHIQCYELIHKMLDTKDRQVRVAFAHHVRSFDPMNPKNPLHQGFTWLDDALFNRGVEDSFVLGKFSTFLGTPKTPTTPGFYADAIGINYYSRTAVTGFSDGTFPDVPVNDLGWEIYPQGLLDAARRLSEKYQLPIWVTEIGTVDNGSVDKLERFRCRFLLDHVTAMAEACADGVPIERYYHWCFVDNWEWTEGTGPLTSTDADAHGLVAPAQTNAELNERPDVSEGWLTQYGLAYFGSCIGWAAPSQLLLSNQLMILRPEDKENALSLLMMIGGAAMVITSLFTGYLSDRTKSRIGRRMPWILAGAFICAFCLVLVSQMATGSGLRKLLEAERHTEQFGDNSTEYVFTDTVTLEKGAYRDDWWVFASRFVVHIGNYVALFYLLFYLKDHIGMEDPDGGVMMLTVIYAACTVVTAIVGGNISDKLNRRKIFVVISAWSVGIATLLMAFASSLITVIIAAVILGLAWGVSTSVDKALINESPPSEKNRARDVSIMTLTVGITNMISGGVAALALNYLGGYSGLYLLCTVVCVVGSAFVFPVRSSR